ncbi:MAG: PAS domain S-box protein [Bryobacteraceae bacterium]
MRRAPVGDRLTVTEPQAPSRLVAYLVGVLASALVIVLRLWLDSELRDAAPALLYLLPPVFAGWLGGRDPALVATTLIVLGGWFFVSEPRGSLSILNPSEIVALSLTASVGLAISLLSGRMHTLLAESRRNEARFRILAEAMPHLVFQLSPDEELTFANRKWREYFGRERLSRSEWAEVVHPDDLPSFAQAWEAMVAGGGSGDFELRMRRHDGAWRWFEVRTVGAYDERGRLLHWVGTSTDVHEKQEARLALRESEARFRAMIDSIPQLAWMADAKGWIFWYNRRWYEYTGTTLDEMQGWGWKQVHHPDHVERVVTRVQHSWDTGEVWEDTFPLRGRNGEWRWFLSRALPIRNERGEIVTWFGTNTDITEQLETEAALRRSEAYFRGLADTVPGIVWAADPAGRIDYLNAWWYEYTGAPPGTMAQGQFVHPDDRGRFLELWEHSRRTGDEFQCTVRVRRHDGTYRWFMARARASRDAAGALERWFGAAVDIDDQKMIEEALRRSNEDLEQFAYVASHDLQEPLRTVVSFSQLLVQKHSLHLDAEALEYLDYIVGAGRRMSDLIRDLLTYSRATSDRDAVRTRVALDDVLRRVLAALKFPIQQSAASIEYGPLPVVWGDQTQLGQLFQNLISNSLKYCRNGVPPRVEIHAERRMGDWLISVRDNGQGFPQELSERIFGIFKRLHGRRLPGTGIGLAIARAVVERHGGKIWAESAPGAGSTFHFTLPALHEDAPPVESSDHSTRNS